MPISTEHVKSYRDKAYINSILCAQSFKISNIVLNTWTSLILSLVGNFKLTEQATNFKQIEITSHFLTL